MKTSHIFWGTLFITLGLLVLIANLTSLNLYLGNLWSFWPLVLIIFGISMLVRNKLGKGVLAGVAAVFLAVVLFTSIKLTSNFINSDFQLIFDHDSDSNYTISEYTEALNSPISKAKLKLDAGIGSFNIKRSTDDLIYVRAKGSENNYVLSRNDVDSLSNIELQMKDRKIHIGKNDFTNKVDIYLNENPVWNLDLNVGASAIDLDLKRFNVENVEVDMGAASLDIRLGDKADSTKLEVKAGASEINISVPSEVGCQVKMDDVLSSKKLVKFERINSDLYRTSNFDDADKKIFIEIDCGVSSVSIKRY